MSLLSLAFSTVSLWSVAPVTPVACDDGPKMTRTAAKAALDRVAQSKRDTRHLDGIPKLEAMEAAATAYADVATTYAKYHDIRAEGWFRSGETWRTLRQVEKAMEAFTQSAACDEAPDFAARAVLEIGHLHRRTKRYDDALTQYKAVETRFPAQRLSCVRARTWAGKVELHRKNVDAGHSLLLTVGEDFPEFPVEHIRNVDLVAVDWIEAGRAEEARALVEACVTRHETPPKEGGEVDKDVSKALAKMKARERLARLGNHI